MSYLCNVILMLIVCLRYRIFYEGGKIEIKARTQSDVTLYFRVLVRNN